jgi:hypothetical protein
MSLVLLEIIGVPSVARLLEEVVSAGLFLAATLSLASAPTGAWNGMAMLLLVVVVGLFAHVLYEFLLIALWGRMLGKLVREGTDSEPAPVTGLVGFLIGLWWGTKWLSPACGPLLPACVVVL